MPIDGRIAEKSQREYLFNDIFETMALFDLNYFL